MELEEVFGPGGALVRALVNWERRPPQEAMAAGVARALDREENLVVEAGTGVGKSLAYLIPAALWAVRNARRVLVSTHTRALQEQLVHGDLPIVSRVLGEMGLPLRFALLMGAENYLCVQNLSKQRAQPALTGGGSEGVLDGLAAWAQTADTGHRSALPMDVPQKLWERLARDSGVCLGPSGPFWDRCLWRRDRERAEKAHIVVVNHALLMSGARLPPYDAMILDEAHNLEEAAVSRFGSEVTLGRVVTLAEEARLTARLAGDGALMGTVDAAEGALAAFLRELAHERGLKGAEEDASGRLLEKTPASSPPSSPRSRPRSRPPSPRAKAAPRRRTSARCTRARPSWATTWPRS